MKKISLSLIVISLLIVSGCATQPVTKENDSQNNIDVEEENSNTMNNDEMAENGMMIDGMAGDDMVVEEMMEDDMMSGTGHYVAYSEEEATEALNRGDKTVIFFHAAWCPECQAADKDFKENLDKLGKNVTILKADYDTEKELKEKYGVIIQTTFVEIDKDMNLVKKWSGGNVARVNKELGL